jgi:hypothetical protein
LSYKYLEGIVLLPPLFFPFCYLNFYWGHVASHESFDVKEICFVILCWITV